MEFRACYALAHALGVPLSVIDAMPEEEIAGHLAYMAATSPRQT